MRAALLVLTLSLCACSRPDPPKIQPESATVAAVSPSGMTVRTVLALYNPNDISLSARSVKAEVTLADQVKMGPIDVPSGVSLASKQWTRVTVDIATRWEDAAKLASVAAASPTVPYVVTGTVAVGTEKVNLNVPFTLKGTVKREELLAAGMKGLPAIPGLPLPLPR